MGTAPESVWQQQTYLSKLSNSFLYPIKPPNAWNTFSAGKHFVSGTELRVFLLTTHPQSVPRNVLFYLVLAICRLWENLNFTYSFRGPDAGSCNKESSWNFSLGFSPVEWRNPFSPEGIVKVIQCLHQAKQILLNLTRQRGVIVRTKTRSRHKYLWPFFKVLGDVMGNALVNDSVIKNYKYRSLGYASHTKHSP